MATPDFFRARLDQMIDLKHPLAVLAQRLPWAQIDASLAPFFPAATVPVVRFPVRIPRQPGHGFRRKLDSDSTASWTAEVAIRRMD